MTSAAQLELYADATLRRKRTSAPCVGWPLAAIKALEGLGIRHKPDHARLTPLILARLEERGEKARSPRPQRAGSITAEQAATDFNKYLANKHRDAARFGGTYEVNFAQLAAEVDAFRITYYPRLASDQVPEVAEILTAVRAKWGMRAAKTRTMRARRIDPVQAAQQKLF